MSIKANRESLTCLVGQEEGVDLESGVGKRNRENKNT
jgi:hypothetical protein